MIIQLKSLFLEAILFTQLCHSSRPPFSLPLFWRGISTGFLTFLLLPLKIEEFYYYSFSYYSFCISLLYFQ
nr:MAG TPA: hypothetical protein [Caudoviricetes sp.]